MLLKQLDNWVRRAVNASKLETVERRNGQDRRQRPDRRQDYRQEYEDDFHVHDRRKNVDRRKQAAIIPEED